jgi:membrane protein
MRELSPYSPEARRKRLALMKARFGSAVVDRVRPGTRSFEVVRRVTVGAYNDGFIHAGNLAYLAILTLFPFFIFAAALTGLLGSAADGQRTVASFLQQFPPDVAAVLAAPINDVLTARTGNLLWLGAIVGLWTATSLIETIRDILRRAYGVPFSKPFWEYRLWSIGLMLAAVVLLMMSFALSVVLSSFHHLVVTFLPFAEGAVNTLGLYRLAPAVFLFGTFYALFYALTPGRYRKKAHRKWPGALLVTGWWLGTTELLPHVIGLLGGYALTYGSLAGIMVALIYFFLIGMGVVLGAELNAALAETDGTALKGEVYSGPFKNELEVEEPEPGEDVDPDAVKSGVLPT